MNHATIEELRHYLINLRELTKSLDQIENKDHVDYIYEIMEEYERTLWDRVPL